MQQLHNLSKPLVSVITVNYNQLSVTKELLYSLERQSWSNLEVIVVDNGSDENPEEELKRDFPWVRVIRSEKNLGFAGGNNLGIERALGDYFLFLNNDTEVPNGTIGELVITLWFNEDAGAVSPLIYYYDQPDLIQYAGYTAMNMLTGKNRAVGFRKNWKLSNKVVETYFTHGAAMMVKREVIQKVGGMPENYFLYYEELDWGQMIRNAGYKLLVTHKASVQHKESISTGKDSPLKTYFQTRNRILFMRRNNGIIKCLGFLLFFLVLTFPKNIMRYVLKREWQHMKSFMQAVGWHFRYDINSPRIGYIYERLRG